MNPTKKILKFIGIGVAFCLLLVIGIFGYSYSTTAGARTMGNEFVTHIHGKQFDKAYALLHKKLQAKVSRADFDAMITKGGIDKVQSVSWNQWEVSDGIKTVSGLTPDGAIAVNIKVTDIENDGKSGIMLFNFANAPK